MRDHLTGSFRNLTGFRARTRGASHVSASCNNTSLSPAHCCSSKLRNNMNVMVDGLPHAHPKHRNDSTPRSPPSTNRQAISQPSRYAFLNHSTVTVHQNLPPSVDDKPLARQRRRRTRFVFVSHMVEFTGCQLSLVRKTKPSSRRPTTKIRSRTNQHVLK